MLRQFFPLVFLLCHILIVILFTLIFIFCFTEALKYYGNRLTEYERTEISNYPEIWYLGLDSCKIHGDKSLSQNGGYDDENGSYNKVSFH